MKVLIVCGAGASSTFVAQRLRRAAAAHGRELTALASSAIAAPGLVATVDVVLVGAHLGEAIGPLETTAAAAQVPIVVLADAARMDGDALLEKTLAAIAADDRERTP